MPSKSLGASLFGMRVRPWQRCACQGMVWMHFESFLSSTQQYSCVFGLVKLGNCSIPIGNACFASTLEKWTNGCILRGFPISRLCFNKLWFLTSLFQMAICSILFLEMLSIFNLVFLLNKCIAFPIFFFFLFRVLHSFWY